MGEEGTIEQVLKVLTNFSHSVPVLRVALATLSNLAFDSEMNKIGIVEHGHLVIMRLWEKYFETASLTPRFSLLFRNISSSRSYCSFACVYRIGSDVANTAENKDILQRYHFTDKLARYLHRHKSDGVSVWHLLWAQINVTCGHGTIML